MYEKMICMQYGYLEIYRSGRDIAVAVKVLTDHLDIVAGVINSNECVNNQGNNKLGNINKRIWINVV